MCSTFGASTRPDFVLPSVSKKRFQAPAPVFLPSRENLQHATRGCASSRLVRAERSAQACRQMEATLSSATSDSQPGNNSGFERIGLKSTPASNFFASSKSEALSRSEADLRVRAVAKRLRGTTATSAQPGLCQARDDPAGAADDLKVAAHPQRAVKFGVDR